MASLNCRLTLIHLNSVSCEKSTVTQSTNLMNHWFYLTDKTPGDPQSSWWHWRTGTAFCLAGWTEGRCLQLMLLHGVEVGTTWLKVLLTCQVPVWA